MGVIAAKYLFFLLHENALDFYEMQLSEWKSFSFQIGGSYVLWYFCVIQRAVVKKVRDKIVNKIKEIKSRTDTTEDPKAKKLMKTIRKEAKQVSWNFFIEVFYNKLITFAGSIKIRFLTKSKF